MGRRKNKTEKEERKRRREEEKKKVYGTLEWVIRLIEREKENYIKLKKNVLKERSSENTCSLVSFDS